MLGGAGVVVAVTCDAAGCGVGLGVVFAFGLGLVSPGASGVGVNVCEPLACEDADVNVDDGLTGASTIRGAASLRAPLGGSSGVGVDAPYAAPESAAASRLAHAATAIRVRRSIRRRDDVLVDIRPSLFR